MIEDIIVMLGVVMVGRINPIIESIIDFSEWVHCKSQSGFKIQKEGV
jgi:hypothetical protein